MNKTINRGFTLLELLVVIGIIGILVSLITVSFSSAQKSARDSRRRQDLTAIQNAMEQYYAATSFTYPGCGGVGGATSCPQLDTYMVGGVPVDPLSTNPQYVYTGSGSSYTVTATLERPVTTISVSNLQ